MTYETIEKFVETGTRKNKRINVHFKTRNTISGLFIVTNDYNELKTKNFWRIVPEARVKEWQDSKDLSLSRLFNGAEFTRLSDE